MTNLVLVTSNGTGMGHLMRQVSVARATQHPTTIFSLSLGLPLATRLGVAGEYCPSYDLPWIASNRWHGYLRDRLVALCREVDADGVLFDGVAPYPGIGLAANELRDVAFAWLRRGMWRADSGTQHLKKTSFFDLVIEPGDLGSSADSGPTAGLGDAESVAPISILETYPMESRTLARQQLGLPREGPIALVTLGSGRLGDVEGPGAVAVKTLLEAPEGWHVAVTRSPVAVNDIPTGQAERVTQLADVYPLAAFLKAFDVAVSSAGYNAVHELIPAGIPTLFAANTSTRTDDQSSRARGVEDAGLGLAINDSELDELPSQILALTEQRERISAAAAETIGGMTGASETAQLLAAFADTYSPARRSFRATATGAWRGFKDSVKVAVGEDATNRIRAALGREAPTAAHPGTKVRVGPTTGDADDSVPLLQVIQSLQPEDLKTAGPVEHILPGSSDDYFEERRALISEYYDLVD